MGNKSRCRVLILFWSCSKSGTSESLPSLTRKIFNSITNEMKVFLLMITINAIMKFNELNSFLNAK